MGTLALASPMPADAQLRASDDTNFQMRAAVGWAGTITDALLGAGGVYMFDGNRWGLYLDAKIPHDSLKRRPSFEEDLSVAQVETEFPFERRVGSLETEEWRVLNLGFVRPISSETALIIGGGVAHHSVIREYRDNGDPPLFRGGVYYVEDEMLTRWEPNLMGSLLFQGGSSVAFTAGFDWAPRSFSLGILYLIE